MAIRPITDTLRLLEGGTLLDTLSDKMADLVKQVDTTDKPGELVLRLKVKRVSSAAIGVVPTYELKVPKEKPEETLLYPTPEGNLTQDHPKQQKLALQPVEDTRPSNFQKAC